MALSRRGFFSLAGTTAAGVAVASPLQALFARAAFGQSVTTGYGALAPVMPENVAELPPEYQNSLLQLPPGFKYTAFSIEGQPMSDGSLVPADHDGMAAFPGPRGTTLLVRNHELSPNETPAVQAPSSMKYDPLCAGGTTTLIVSADRKLVRDYTSLAGTYRNCAGGPTPWGSWVSSEENTSTPAGNNGGSRDVSTKHGYNFEVPARGGLVTPVALTDMGRFNHEAIAVDPATGYVYETEDRGDSCFYRFKPNQYGQLNSGGILEAMVIKGMPAVNTKTGFLSMKGQPLEVEWVTLQDVDPAEDTLRFEAQDKGAAIFSRGEGIWYGNSEIYWTCTNGGDAGLGQVWRYDPDTDTVSLFVESEDQSVLDNPDNITVAPFGDVFLCEDGDGEQYIVGVTPQGELYQFAKNNLNTREWAGACFSADGKTMFVNIQTPGITFAIWPESGSWSRA